MKVVVEDVEYELANVLKSSLRNLMALEDQSEAEGRRITAGVVELWQKNLKKCTTNAEREAHPDSKWLFAVMLWTAFRESGAPRTFGQVLDLDLEHVRYVFTDEELAAAAAVEPDPTKPPKSTSASGRVTRLPQDRKKASKPRSAVAS